MKKESAGIKSTRTPACFNIQAFFWECFFSNTASRGRSSSLMATCRVHSNYCSGVSVGFIPFTTRKVSMQSAAVRLFPSRNG